MSPKPITLITVLYLVYRCLVMQVGLAAPIKQISAPKAAATKTAPSTPASADEVFPPVLMPEQFFGAAAMGYAAAKATPHVCSKLFCYCGCDITDKHTCLLDCFTSLHGVDCHICQEEALQALRMTRDDEPVPAIQKAIDETYSMKYPFKDESPALKKYKSITRNYALTPETSPISGGSTSSHEGTCCPGK